jgi:hypothetical protein
MLVDAGGCWFSVAQTTKLLSIHIHYPVENFNPPFAFTPFLELKSYTYSNTGAMAATQRKANVSSCEHSQKKPYMPIQNC